MSSPGQRSATLLGSKGQTWTFCGLPAVVIPIAWASGSTVGFLLCYGIAAALGHVRLVLPMLSSCVEQKPEMYLAGPVYIFTLIGLVMNIGAMAHVMHRSARGDGVALPSPATTEATDSSKSCLATWGIASLGFVSIASFAVAGVVTQSMQPVVHETFARSGFFCYATYALFLITALGRRVPALHRHGDIESVKWKWLMMFSGAVAIAIYIAFIAAGFPHDGLAAASCEWTAFFLIILFNLSFVLEFRAGQMQECLDEDTSIMETDGESEDDQNDDKSAGSIEDLKWSCCE